MNCQQQLDWLREHHALVNFGLHDVTIWCVPYTYVVAETLEEAIGLMMGRMGVVESLLGEAHQPLLLARPESE
jgi:hypothetical protein